MAVVFLFERSHEDASIMGELHGVSDNIGQNLSDTTDIAQQNEVFKPEHINANLGLVLGGSGRKQRGDVKHRVVQVERRRTQFHFTRLDLGIIQYAVDNREQSVGRGIDSAGKHFLIFRQFGLAEQIGHTDNAVHGGPDFMAHICQKQVLGLVCNHCALTQFDFFFAGVDRDHEFEGHIAKQGCKNETDENFVAILLRCAGKDIGGHIYEMDTGVLLNPNFSHVGGKSLELCSIILDCGVGERRASVKEIFCAFQISGIFLDLGLYRRAGGYFVSGNVLDPAPQYFIADLGISDR